MILTSDRHRLTWASRCLIALGVAFGVLVMHGTATNHSVPAVSTSSITEHQGVDLTPTAATAGDAIASNVAVTPLLGHPMGGAVCVVILASGVVLPLLSVLRLKWRKKTSDPAPALRHRLGRSAIAALWVAAPSLTRLCVSRT